MGNVYDRTGRKVGSVNAWTGVYDASGRNVGSIDIFSSKVYDAADHFVGTADWHGNVHDASGRFLCQVPFLGFQVKDASGNVIGSVEIAGAPEPPPDMQWRGAAALLLLCLDQPTGKPDLEALAFEYLSAPTASQRRQLLEAGTAVVLPLARALAGYFISFGRGFKSERERGRVKDDWDAQVLNGILRPAADVIAGIGEPAVERLVRSLPESDRTIQKAIALLLAVGDRPDDRMVAELADMLRRGKIDDTATIMLLTFVLAHGGDVRAQRGIAEFAQSEQMDIGSCLARTIDTAILELLGWEQGIAVQF